MKKLKRIMAVILTFIVAVSMAACTEEVNPDGRPEEKVDHSKTQLNVSNFNGGYGDEWLYKAKYRFEEKYAETSFEEGKTGVQVWIDNNKDQGHNVLTYVKDSPNNVFFTQGVSYYDFLSSNALADVTDIMTEDLSEKYGENGTILDKFNDLQKEYFGVDGHYYAIPYCGGFYGIMYDVDLFVKKGFYFAADTTLDANAVKYNTDLSNGNNGFIYDKTDVKSNGPDGKPGTSDDGLPATYDEFFMLCDYILSAGCKPTIWTGQYRNDYIKDILRALVCDYEGSEMALNFNFDGTATHLVKSIDASGNVTFEAPTQINNSNGYKYMATAGKYYAMKFYQQLTSNAAYYHNKCFNETQSHTDAQNDFLFSRPEGREPIAMLLEGTYWANEAKDTFEEIAGRYGSEYDAYHRQIGIMPLPKATKEQVGDPYTIYGDVGSLGFINSNCNATQLKVAKLFLQFVNTEVSLREFTVTTNTIKELKYSMTEEDLAQMTQFGRLLWNIKDGLNTVHRASKNPIFLNNSSIFTIEGYDSKIGSTTYNRPADQLRGNSSDKISAADYFFGISNYYTQSWWNGLVGVK